MATLRRWWSNKYRLPPGHELFRGQTFAELNQEMMEDLFLRRDEVLEELKDDDSRPKSRQEILLTQLRTINRALGEDISVTQDDLADYWDEQLERGETPDLDMTVEDLKRLKMEGRA